ncbi:MAG: ATP-dependent DNA helicase RecG [Anaerolineales bacterium]
MKPSIDKLYKFFKQEIKSGFENRAVLGGLQKMPGTWENDARADALPENLIRTVHAHLRDYHQLTVKSRPEVLAELWGKIQKILGESLPDLGIEAPAPEPPPKRAAPPPPKPPATAHSAPLKQEHTASPPRSEPSRAQEPARPPVERPAPMRETPRPAPRPEPVVEMPAPVSPAPVASLPETAAPPAPSVSLASVPIIPAEPEPEPESEPLIFEVPPLPDGEIAALNAPLTVLSGVGPKHAKSLEKLGLATLGDALYYFPRRYEDYSQLKPINRLWYGEEVTVIGVISQITARPTRGGKVQMIEALLTDGSGSLRVNWFNQPWLVEQLRGKSVALSGKIEQYLGRLIMNSPTHETLDKKSLHTNRIVPIYPLTSDLTQKWLRQTLHQVVSYWAPRVQDYMPERIRRSANLLPLQIALLQAHFPDSFEKLEAARHRLGFDEIFLLQLGVMRQRRQWTDRTARTFEAPLTWLYSQFARLPFDLTNAQKRAIDDLRTDLNSGRPMNRLLQGDVGAGKTAVAAMGVAMVVRHGAQAAIMAPTSILAEQHYRGLLRLLAENIPPAISEMIEPEPGDMPPAEEEPRADTGAPRAVDLTPTGEPSPAGELSPAPVLPPVGAPPLRPEQIRLLIGSTSESEKAEIRAGLESGQVKLVIGTHALIEDPIVFADLQLIVIDEQHRFGVNQRAALREKGHNPHLLVMTATPIPRSLALTVYGDLDLSVLDEMPPGRQPVSTHILFPLERERAYRLIRHEVAAGRQAFIIYPLVEESEKSEAKAAVEEHQRLQTEVFPHLSLGLLHGRMRPDEKEEVMRRFRDGEHQILVSTSVVEVGVDVPNATVMIIEGANRFGLAQLHQFRGRVGRGQAKSYCILIPDSDNKAENERLNAMTQTNDGFVLAQRDLEQRGPGDFLGTRQAGFSELKMASLTDVRLIEKARHHAQELFATDPDLTDPTHHLLTRAMRRFWGEGEGDIS